MFNVDDIFRAEKLIKPSKIQPNPIPVVQPFVGREFELNFLRSTFSESQTILVVGTFGTGKTALAAQFARQVKLESDNVFWFTLRKGMDSVQAILLSLSIFITNIGGNYLFDYLNVENLAGKNFPAQRKIAALTKDLSKRNLLICIDNIHLLESHKSELRFISRIERSLKKDPALRNVKMLLAGRYSSLSKKDNTLNLKEMKQAEFFELCNALGFSRNSKSSVQLFEYLGGNPYLVSIVLKMAQENRYPLETLFKSKKQFFLRPEIRHYADNERYILNKQEIELAKIASTFEHPITESKLRQILHRLQNPILFNYLLGLVTRGILEYRDSSYYMPEIYRYYYQLLLGNENIKRLSAVIYEK